MKLEAFAGFFLSFDFARIAPVEFFDFGDVLSLVVHRDPPFQVELFILRAGDGFPRQHRHPHVDAYECSLGNDPPFIVNGQPAKDSRFFTRPSYEVKSSDWHGVGVVNAPVSFLSIQKWNGRQPSSVALDWEGTPFSLSHRAQLRQPRAFWRKTVHGDT